MSTTTTVPDHAVEVLARIVNPDNGEWTAETAQAMLAFRLDDDDRDRVNELAARSRAGTLTAEDRAELDGYEIATALIELLQSKARRSLEEIAAEDEFDRKIAGTADKLTPLTEQALAEYRAGKTEPLENLL